MNLIKKNTFALLLYLGASNPPDQKNQQLLPQRMPNFQKRAQKNFGARALLIAS